MTETSFTHQKTLSEHVIFRQFDFEYGLGWRASGTAEFTHSNTLGVACKQTGDRSAMSGVSDRQTDNLTS